MVLSGDLRLCSEASSRLRYGNPRKELSRVSPCFDVCLPTIRLALSTKAFLPRAKRISASNLSRFLVKDQSDKLGFCLSPNETERALHSESDIGKALESQSWNLSAPAPPSFGNPLYQNKIFGDFLIFCLSSF